MTTHKPSEVRRDQILDAALALARKGNYMNITRDRIALQAGVSPGTVSGYFGTMPNLRRDIMRAAIRAGAVEVVAQGLANRDKQALKAPAELKAAAAALMMGG
jgi:AcrR family transcriptional regulator